jgi:hypothetical protein
MLRRFGIFVLAAITVSACTSIRDVPLERSDVSKIEGKEIAIVKRPMPDFGAMTADKMAAAGMFGAIGGAIAGAATISAGNSLVRENHIPDPAYEIAEEIAHSMEAKYGAKYAGIGSSVITDDEPSSVSTAYKAVPLALDVKTYNWGFTYFPMSWNTYRVVYHSRLRLIDTNTAVVMAEGGCSRVPEKTDDAPTYDQLIENGASRLKAEIEKAARFCAAQFSAKYLGMSIAGLGDFENQAAKPGVTPVSSDPAGRR